ncbi:hypothetical protein GBAR_LOCUS645 [Geodia barretti]|uniref:Uncharacterized protein n=1 Tax=Geodia barretti TaxID=519541 RepID=A0AA35W3Q3_GEOBA|nr:hypothetical protein GBAR_LOCUS645 [Geodia barretti]
MTSCHIPLSGTTFRFAFLAHSSSLAKTPSLHSTITCSWTAGNSCTLDAAMASPKPISRTRPPFEAAMLASLCMKGVSQRSMTGLPMISRCVSALL